MLIPWAAKKEMWKVDGKILNQSTTHCTLHFTLIRELFYCYAIKKAAWDYLDFNF